MLAIPPFWASSKNALLRANTKPPVELVVADLEEVMDALAENGSDTYLQFKLMVKASAAENGQEAVLRLWDKIFAEADSKRPMLLEMH